MIHWNSLTDSCKVGRGSISIWVVYHGFRFVVFLFFPSSTLLSFFQPPTSKNATVRPFGRCVCFCSCLPTEVFKYDGDHVDLLEQTKPWQKKPKYFETVRVSALAAMKMLKHALSGVHRGQERGTKPLEVMGLMLGKPEGNSVIIMDCFPLPVEGTESRVVADDEAVSNYMINLSEALENVSFDCPDCLLFFFF